MGAWGAGLYSNDFACDLRATIRSVIRLPYNENELTDILCKMHAQTALDPNDEEYTIFWLVLADQFVSRNMCTPLIKENSISIIDSEKDLSLMTSLGMSTSDVKKRAKNLQELRNCLTADASHTPKKRNTLKKPQVYVMEVGDCFFFPTFNRKTINPYMPPQSQEPDGYGALIIIERGRAFNFLSWYRPLVCTQIMRAPEIDSIDFNTKWAVLNPGSFSSLHFKRMEFKKVCSFPIDKKKVHSFFPDLVSGDSFAIEDISLCNSLFSLESDGSGYGKNVISGGLEPLFR